MRSIDDPDAVKPDDWDEDAPEEIEDPEATMPEVCNHRKACVSVAIC